MRNEKKNYDGELQKKTKDSNNKKNKAEPLHPRAAAYEAGVVGQSQRRHDGSAPKARQRDAIMAVSPGSSRAGLTVTNCG